METISIQLAAVSALLQVMPSEQAVALVCKVLSGLAATVANEPGTLVNFADNASRLLDPAHALLLFNDLREILRDADEDVQQNIFRTMALWERGYGEDLKRMRVLVSSRIKRIKEAAGEIGKAKDKKRGRDEARDDSIQSRWLYMEIEVGLIATRGLSGVALALEEGEGGGGNKSVRLTDSSSSSFRR